MHHLVNAGARSIGGFGMFLPGIHMETPEAPGAAPAAAAPPPAPAPAPAAAAAPPAAPADPAADPAGVEDSQFDEAAFQEFLADEIGATLNGLLPQYLPRFLPQPGAAGPGGAPEPGGAPAGFDWASLDPLGDGYGQMLGQGIQETIRGELAAAFGALRAEQQQQAMQAAEARRLEIGQQNAQDMIADAISRGDDITDVGKQIVDPLAEALVPQFAARYGESPRAAELAIDQAVNIVREIERAAIARGTTSSQNHLATLAGAPAVPPAQAAAAHVPGQPAKRLTTAELLSRHTAA